MRGLGSIANKRAPRPTPVQAPNKVGAGCNLLFFAPGFRAGFGRTPNESGFLDDDLIPKNVGFTGRRFGDHQFLFGRALGLKQTIHVVQLLVGEIHLGGEFHIAPLAELEMNMGRTHPIILGRVSSGDDGFEAKISVLSTGDDGPTLKTGIERSGIGIMGVTVSSGRIRLPDIHGHAFDRIARRINGAAKRVIP